jgi:glucosamine-6-phosphate deaminase
MEVVIVGSHDEAGELAAQIIAAQVRAKPRAVIGLATGSTPLPIYRALAAKVAAGLDVSQVAGFALDEYVGLPTTHPASYHTAIATTVVEPLGLDPARVAVPEGNAVDLSGACAEFEAAITAAGGVDVQILGIGADGHVGFNEPTSSLSSRTRLKTLTPQTRRDNARFFGSQDDVPQHCVTQGLGTILEARQLVLLGIGAEKAAAIAAAVEGPLASICPASVIQLHRHVTVIVDEPAAAQLALADYYRHTYANKPDWQHPHG